MSKKVFISFLGMGNLRKETPYEPIKYSLDGKTSTRERMFVQSSILELYPEQFDKIIILSTNSSKTNIPKFKEEISDLKIREDIFDISINDISDSLSDLNDAWSWFEKLNSKIDEYDEIVLDVTHGFRIVPIVLSTAIGYLKRAKKIEVLGVLYGAYTPPKEDSKAYPIVDVKDFYTINDWAEGIGRLIDDADARFITKIAKEEKASGFSGLNNRELLNQIEKLTNSVRNVELQNVESNARSTLTAIQTAIQTAKPLEKQILQLVIDKFTPLIYQYPNGRYSKEYLSMQVKLIELLYEHKMYMQCFTAMREWIGSLGLAVLGEHSHAKKKDDSKARRYADVFINMLQYPEDKWDFDEQATPRKEKLYPAYTQLKNIIVNIEDFQTILKGVNKVRNGFDHGWTGSHIDGVPEKLKDIYNNAKLIFQSIIDKWDNIKSSNF